MTKKPIKNKLQFSDILKGKFLVDENASKNWWFLLFLVFLGFLSIRSSHIVDQKSLMIYRLKNDVKEKQSEFAAIHKNRMKSHSLEYIKPKAEKLFLTLPNEAPRGIVVQSIDSIKSHD